MQICPKELIDLEQGGSPIQVVHGGKRKHTALLRLVDGKAGARGLVGLVMWGDH